MRLLPRQAGTGESDHDVDNSLQILRATQFFEFVGGIVDTSTDGQIARLSPALFQPVASDDVAAALADVTLADPVNGMIELAGPEQLSLDEFGRTYLAATKDPRKVVADIHARYFGAELDDRSLTPGNHPRLGAIRFEDWLGHRSQVTRRLPSAPRRDRHAASHANPRP